MASESCHIQKRGEGEGERGKQTVGRAARRVCRRVGRGVDWAVFYVGDN